MASPTPIPPPPTPVPDMNVSILKQMLAHPIDTGWDMLKGLWMLPSDIAYDTNENRKYMKDVLTQQAQVNPTNPALPRELGPLEKGLIDVKSTGLGAVQAGIDTLVPGALDVPPGEKANYIQDFGRTNPKTSIGLGVAQLVAPWLISKAIVKPVSAGVSRVINSPPVSKAISSVVKTAETKYPWYREFNAGRTARALEHSPLVRTKLVGAGDRVEDLLNQAVERMPNKEHASTLLKLDRLPQEHFDNILKAAQSNDDAQIEAAVRQAVSDMETSTIAELSAGSQLGQPAAGVVYDNTIRELGLTPAGPVKPTVRPFGPRIQLSGQDSALVDLQRALLTAKRLPTTATDFYPLLYTGQAKYINAINAVEHFYTKTILPSIRIVAQTTNTNGQEAVNNLGNYIAAKVHTRYKGIDRKFGSHLDDQTAANLMRDMDSNPALNDAVDQVLIDITDKNRELLNLLHDSDLISTEMHANLVNKYDAVGYLNLERTLSTEAPELDELFKFYGSGGNPIKHAQYGKFADVNLGTDDLIGHQMDYARRVLKLVHTHEFYEGFARMLKTYSDGRIAKVVLPYLDPQSPQQILDFVNSTGQVLDNGRIPVGPLQPNEVPFQAKAYDPITGERKLTPARIQFTDEFKFLADALNETETKSNAGLFGVANQTTNARKVGAALLSWPEFFSKWIVQGRVSLNPFFWLRNVPRDMSGVEFAITNELGPQAGPIFLKNLRKVNEFNRTDTGSSIAYNQMSSYQAPEFTAELAKWVNTSKLITKADELLDGVRFFRSVSENMTRRAVELTAKEMGVSDVLAADLALRSSGNFLRRGAASRISNAFYPFFNARWQILRNQLGIVSGKPGIAFESMAQHLLALTLYYEELRYLEPLDETGVHRLSNLTEYERRNYFQLPSLLGGGKIPLSGPPAWLNNVALILSEEIHGRSMPADSAAEIMKSFVDSNAPVNMFDDNNKSFAEGLIPPGIVPIDTKYFRGPASSRGTERLDWDTLNADTPEYQAKLSEAINRYTGLSVQPQVFNLKNYPFIPGYITSGQDLIDRQFVDPANRKSIGQVMGFAGANKDKAMSRMFFKVSQYLTNHPALRYERTYEDRDPDLVDTIKDSDEYWDLRELKKRSGKIARDLSDINKVIRDPSYTASERSERLAESREMMRDYLRDAYPVYLKTDPLLPAIHERERKKLSAEVFEWLDRNILSGVDTSYLEVGEGGLQSPALNDEQ